MKKDMENDRIKRMVADLGEDDMAKTKSKDDVVKKKKPYQVNEDGEAMAMDHLASDGSLATEEAMENEIEGSTPRKRSLFGKKGLHIFIKSE